MEMMFELQQQLMGERNAGERLIQQLPVLPRKVFFLCVSVTRGTLKQNGWRHKTLICLFCLALRGAQHTQLQLASDNELRGDRAVVQNSNQLYSTRGQPVAPVSGCGVTPRHEVALFLPHIPHDLISILHASCDVT